MKDMPRKRNRFQCQRCGCAFWSREVDPMFCGRSCSARNRIETHGLQGLRPGNHRPAVEPPIVFTDPPESEEHVERLLRAVRLRKAREAWLAATRKDAHTSS